MQKQFNNLRKFLASTSLMMLFGLSFGTGIASTYFLGSIFLARVINPIIERRDEEAMIKRYEYEDTLEYEYVETDGSLVVTEHSVLPHPDLQTVATVVNQSTNLYFDWAEIDLLVITEGIIVLRCQERVREFPPGESEKYM